MVQVKVTAARAASTSTGDDALAGLARRYDQGTTATVMDWEYLAAHRPQSRMTSGPRPRPGGCP